MQPTEDIMSFIPDLRVAEFASVLLQIFGVFLFVTVSSCPFPV